MRASNVILFFTTFFLPAVITVLLTPSFLYLPVSYSIILGMYIGIFEFLNFLRYRVISRKYRTRLISPYVNYRVAAVVPVYNEDPEIVKGTVLSIISAIKGRGNVFVLDDSTDEKIKKK